MSPDTRLSDPPVAPAGDAEAPAGAAAAPRGGRRRGLQLGIGGKLFLAFGGVAALTLASAAVAWLSYANVEKAVLQALKTDVPAMTTALALSSESAALAAAAPALAGARDEATRQAVSLRLSAQLDELRGKVAGLRVDRGDGETQAVDAVGRQLDRLDGELTALDETVAGALELTARRTQQVAAVEAAYNEVSERVGMLIDDSSFLLVQRADEVTANTGTSISTLMNREVAALRGALEVLAEVNLVGGLVAEAANASNPDRLVPLRERLQISIGRIDDSLASMPADMAGVEEAKLLALLLAEFGQAEQNVFDLRRDWLALSGWELNEKQVIAARLEAITADMLSVQKEMLHTLAPLVDEANFNVVLGSEQATGDASQAVGKLMSEGVGELRSLLALRAELSDLTNAMVQGAVAPHLDFLDAQEARYAEIGAGIERRLADLPADLDDGTLERRVAALAALGSGQAGLFAVRRAELLAAAKAESALEAARGAATALDRQVAAFVEAAQADLTASGRSVAAAITRGQGLLLAIAAASIVIAALIAWLYVGRGLLRRLRLLGADMGRIAAGDLASEVSVSGRDELSEMGEALSSLRRDLAAAEEERARNEAEREAAARQRRQEMLDLATSFEMSVAQVVESLSTASGGLQSTAEGMSSAAQTAGARAQAVAGASAQTAGSVNAAASAAEQLSASISEIGRQVSQSTGIAGQARERVESTNAQVEGLAQAAERIGAVVTLISEIAEQTNLLALNATIEAARAGEAGKGFAVVASEVKNLATQTAKATEEISQQVGGMQTATRDSVGAIQAIGKTILEMNEIAEAIAAAVTEQNAATEEIAGTVRQASAGTQEVNTNIAQVSESVGETGRAADAVLDASGAMSEQTDRLKEEVERFLATVRAA